MQVIDMQYNIKVTLLKTTRWIACDPQSHNKRSNWLLRGLLECDGLSERVVIDSTLGPVERLVCS